jgi:hypothetical protein
MEKWFKRIWFLNGILVLFAVCFFLWQQVRLFFPGRYESIKKGPIVGEKLDKAIKDTLALQDISMTLPRKVGSSLYNFIQLQANDLTVPTRFFQHFNLLGPPFPDVKPYYAYESDILEENNTFNLVFIKLDGSDAHLLLDRKGFIATADIPNETDTVQKYCIYRLVFEDTDNDGRLTSSDRFDLYLSDFYGKNLRQITDRRIKVTRFLKLIRENRLMILAKVRPSNPNINEKDWPEKLFIYDIKSNQLSPYFTDDSLLNKAREILLSK